MSKANGLRSNLNAESGRALREVLEPSPSPRSIAIADMPEVGVRNLVEVFDGERPGSAVPKLKAVSFWFFGVSARLKNCAPKES